MRKPLTGTVLGVLVGLAVAVVLARIGVWPPDQLTVFLLPALTGLAGLAMLTVGRPGSQGTLVVSLVILVPMLVWGALGLARVGESGRVDGGYAVAATSSTDATTVIDTSRADPFVVEPDGGLEWSANSPTVFQDYQWQIHVLIGGIPVPLDSDTEPNDAGDTSNEGVVADIRSYAEERGVDVDLMRGVYQVGGFAATCEGFGFVEIGGEGVDPVAAIAAVVGLVLLITLIVLTFTGRETTVEETRVVVERPPDET